MDVELGTFNNTVRVAGMKHIGLRNRLVRRLDVNPNEIRISGWEVDVEESAIHMMAKAMRVLFQRLPVKNSCLISGMG